MTPAQARRLALAAGFRFYWEAGMKSWACYPQDLSIEATYHTRWTLKPMTAEQFKSIYLSRERA